VATRAGVSRAVFHEVFDSDEQCLEAAFDDSLARLSYTVEAVVAQQERWLERMRAGLVALLGFLDDEPQRARLLVLDTPVDAATEHEWRRQLHRVLSGLIDACHHPSATAAADISRGGGDAVAGACPGMSPALTAELLAGGVFSVIRTGMLERDSAKLVELAPSLMAFIVAPYLGPAAARLELQGKPARREAIANDAASSQISEPSRPAAIARTAALPIRVTHRTTLVLRAIAHAPYLNNREIAQAAGITDEGQASKLLARLEQRGVIENVGVGPARGEPNAWLLTGSGQRAVEVIGQSFDASPRRTRARVRGAR
jgi:AcrR family transcriptional regulator